MELASSSKIHKYKSLPEEDFIRLMHLEPALDPNASLHFAFSKENVSKLVAEYEAISYTWGEPRLDCPLYLVDGSHIMVTHNLDRVLRRLRHPTTKRTLWADAVCINQVDTVEKAKQVPLMAKIFRGASRVLAWLNGGVEEEQGVKILHTLSRSILSVTDERYGRDPQNVLDFSVQGNDAFAIHRFLSLAWFTRVWIIQEVVMNTDVTLICGTSEITWARFTAAVEVLRHLCSGTSGAAPQYKLDALQIIINLWKLHNMSKETKSIQRGFYFPASSEATDDNNDNDGQENILGIVDTLSSYNCTDDRDRVFALYNMAPDIRPLSQAAEAPENADAPDVHSEQWYGYIGSTSLNSRAHSPAFVPPPRLLTVPPLVVYLDVDYSLNTRQVYQQFATACIAKAKIVPVLNAVLARQHPQSSGDWPSWVPDWRKPPSAAFKPLRDVCLYCKQIKPDIIALVRRSWEDFAPLYYLEVAEILPVPHGAAEFENYLREIWRSWPTANLESIILKLLPDEPLAELELLFENLTKESDFDAGLSRLLSLARSAMYNRCLFKARTSPNDDYHGLGNSAVECGDLILSMDEWYTSRHAFKDLPQVMHLRPKAAHSDLEGEGILTTTYRIIGSAYLASPFVDRNFPPSTTGTCTIIYIE